jgi:hypothetical protein
MTDTIILIIALMATAFTFIVAAVLAWMFIQEFKDD